MKRYAFILTLLILALGSIGLAQESKPVPIKQLAGTWRNLDDRTTSVKIRVLDDVNVELEGGLLWKGMYENGVLKLTARPDENAINSDIPDWARKIAAASKSLIWKLTLTPTMGDDGLELKGEILPGEIDWQEVKDPNTDEIFKRTAKVTGSPGKPIPLHYGKPVEWRIADTVVFSEGEAKSVFDTVPKLGSVTSSGNPSDPDAPDVYYIFVYGPHLPVKPEQLLGLKSEDSGIHLKAVAYEQESSKIAGSQMQQENGALMQKGWRLAKDGLTPKEQADMKDWNGLLLRADVEGPIVPGWQEFTLNGLHWGWYCDQGNITASIEILKSVPGGPTGASYEPSTLLYGPGKFKVRVRTKTEVPFPSIGIIIGHNGKPESIDGEQVVNAQRITNTLFETGPISLEPLHNLIAPLGLSSVPHFAIPVETDDVVSCEFADPQLFHVIPASSQALVWCPDESLWERALERATGSAIAPDATSNDIFQIAKQPAASFEDISVSYGSYRLIFKPWAGGFLKTAGETLLQHVQLTAGDQAAMILLKDELEDELSAYRASLPDLQTDQQFLAFGQKIAPAMRQSMSWLPGTSHSPAEGLAYTEIPLQGSLGQLFKLPRGQIFRLGDAFKQDAIGSFSTRAAYDKWLVSVLKQGYKRHLDAVTYSWAKVGATKDSDVEGLLEITGNGIDPVSQRLMPKLVRPVYDPANGDGDWVPDPIAQGYVRNVTKKWEELRAQKEFAAADAAVASAVAGIFLSPVPSFMNKAYTIGDTVNSQLNEHAKAEEEARFAMGLAPVIGTDRWQMADMQRTEVWQILVNLVVMEGQGQIADFAANTIGAGIYKALGAMTKSQAYARVTRIISQHALATALDYFHLPSEDQAAIALLAGGGEIIVRQAGATHIDPQERFAVRVMRSVEEATRTPRLQDPQLLEPVATGPGRLPPALDAQPITNPAGAETPSELILDAFGKEAPALPAPANELPAAPKARKFAPIPPPMPVKPLPGLGQRETPTQIDLPKTMIMAKAANAGGAVEPTAGSDWMAPDGKMFQLKRKVGEGYNAVVFEATDERGYVAAAKYIKNNGAEVEDVPANKLSALAKQNPGNMVVEDTALGERLCEGAGVPVTRSIYYPDAEHPLILTRFVALESDLGGGLGLGEGKYAQGKVIARANGGRLPAKYADAFVEQVVKLKDKGILPVDLNEDNFVFFVRNGKVQMGITDPDLMCTLAEPTPRVLTRLDGYARAGIDLPKGVQQGIVPANTQTVAKSLPLARNTPENLDTVYTLILERLGFIKWNGSGYSSGSLDIGQAERIVPGLSRRQRLNIRDYAAGNQHFDSGGSVAARYLMQIAMQRRMALRAGLF